MLVVHFVYISQRVVDQIETKKHGEPEKKDNYSDKLVDPVAIFTAALVISTILLWRSTERLANLAADQSRDTKASLRISNKSADASVRAARAAEQAFEGSEAPYLYPIVKAYEEGIDPPAPGGGGFASFQLRNFGRSPAVVRDVYYGALVSFTVPEPIPFPAPHTVLTLTYVLAAGEASHVYRIGPGALAAPEGIFDINHGSAWIVGQIRYADLFGNQFVSAFCFSYNALSRNFYGIGGTKHNYRRKLTDEEREAAELEDAGSPMFLRKS